MFFQSEIVYLAHHVSHDGIHPSWEKVHVVEEFPMPETYTQVQIFCGLAGHYRHFIKGFAQITWPLYDVLGREVNMGPVQLPLEVWEAVRILKDKIQTAPMLVFPDFDNPSCLGQMLPRKGWVWHYLRNKMMGATTPLHLGATPSQHPRGTTTILNSNSWPSSGVSLSTSKSTLHMHCLWCRWITTH